MNSMEEKAKEYLQLLGCKEIDQSIVNIMAGFIEHLKSDIKENTKVVLNKDIAKVTLIFLRAGREDRRKCLAKKDGEKAEMVSIDKITVLV